MANIQKYEWINDRTAGDLEAILTAKDILEIGLEIGANVWKKNRKRENALEIKAVTNAVFGNKSHKDINSKNNGLKG